MKTLLGVAAAAAFAAAAQAAPITTAPSPIMAMGGNVTAVFVYADAWDTSKLQLLSSPIDPIFCNHNTSGCTAATPGDIANLGSQSGELNFILKNITTGKTYDLNSPDSDGNYHAKISTDYSQFGVGPLTPSLEATLAGLDNVTFIGFEDLQANNGSDWDYNDLIFAFSNTSPNQNPGVPEPLTLSLAGAGLLGVFGLRRLRKKKA